MCFLWSLLLLAVKRTEWACLPLTVGCTVLDQAIRDAAFSHKSDVFSFGVLMWEICTLGKPPWGAFGVADIVEGLRNGERLQRPGDCPDQMHDLCTRCWSAKPANRPTFAQVNDELQILPAILRNEPATGGRHGGHGGHGRSSHHTGYETEAGDSEFGGDTAPGTAAGTTHGSYVDEPVVMNTSVGQLAAGAQDTARVPADSGGAGGVGGSGGSAPPRAAAALPEMSGYTRIDTGEIEAATAALRAQAGRAHVPPGDGGHGGADDDTGGSPLAPAPDDAKQARRSKRPQRGKQASLYLGFGDAKPGGGGGGGAQAYTTNDTSL